MVRLITIAFPLKKSNFSSNNGITVSIRCNVNYVKQFNRFIYDGEYSLVGIGNIISQDNTLISSNMMSCDLSTPPPEMYSEGFRNNSEFICLLPPPRTVFRGL